jgi:hypothetical protein
MTNRRRQANSHNNSTTRDENDVNQPQTILQLAATSRDFGQINLSCIRPICAEVMRESLLTLLLYCFTGKLAPHSWNRFTLGPHSFDF